MLPCLGSQGTISVDFVDHLLCFPISVKFFSMHTGFTFITIGWTPESGSVIMEVDENHNLSEQADEEVQHCLKNLIANPEYTTEKTALPTQKAG